MTKKTNAFFNFAAILPAILGVMSAIFMAYVFWWPPKMAYVVDQPQTHNVKYSDGTIRIHRAYCINAKVPIIVSREMIRAAAPGQPELRITLPQTLQMYELGCHEIDRIFDVPKGIPHGNYILRFTASWSANPFRDEMVVLPELNVVIEDTK